MDIGLNVNEHALFMKLALRKYETNKLLSTIQLSDNVLQISCEKLEIGYFIYK